MRQLISIALRALACTSALAGLVFVLLMNSGMEYIIIRSGTAAGPTSVPTFGNFCHQYTAPDNSTFLAGVCPGTPTPIPLASPVVVVSAGQQVKFLNGVVAVTCTTAGNGSTDDTACIQAAVNAGDVEVMPGSYIYNTPNTDTGIGMPNNRNIRGCTDPTSDCTSAIANYNPRGKANVNFRLLNTSAAATYGLNFAAAGGTVGYNTTGTFGGSVYGMRFIGNNATSISAITQSVGNAFISLGGGGGGHQQIYVNDFDGLTGNDGAITSGTDHAVDATPNCCTIIGWNIFENNYYDDIEHTKGNNYLVEYNIGLGDTITGSSQVKGDLRIENASDLPGSATGTTTCTGAMAGSTGGGFLGLSCNLYRNNDWLMNCNPSGDTLCSGSTCCTAHEAVVSVSSAGTSTSNYSGNVAMNNHLSATNAGGLDESSNGKIGGRYWNNRVDAPAIINGPPGFNNTGTSCTNPVTGNCSNQ